MKAKTSSATTEVKKPHASKKKATRRGDIPPVRKLKATIPSPRVVSDQRKEKERLRRERSKERGGGRMTDEWVGGGHGHGDGRRKCEGIKQLPSVLRI